MLRWRFIWYQRRRPTDPTRLGLLSAAHHRVNSPVVSARRECESSRGAGCQTGTSRRAVLTESTRGGYRDTETLANVEAAEDAAGERRTAQRRTCACASRRSS